MNSGGGAGRDPVGDPGAAGSAEDLVRAKAVLLGQAAGSDRSEHDASTPHSDRSGHDASTPHSVRDGRPAPDPGHDGVNGHVVVTS